MSYKSWDLDISLGKMIKRSDKLDFLLEQICQHNLITEDGDRYRIIFHEELDPEDFDEGFKFNRVARYFDTSVIYKGYTAKYGGVSFYYAGKLKEAAEYLEKILENKESI